MKNLIKERRWCVRTPEKVPYVDYDAPGHQNNPGEWRTYDDMKELLKRYSSKFAGLGIFLSEREADSDLVIGAIDIDAHHTENGEENALTSEILRMFSGTYQELSPSGNGYHILFDMDRREIPLDNTGNPAYKQKNSENELEIYIGTATNRYMTFTGNRVSDGDEITDQTENVLAFIDKYMKKDLRTRVAAKARERQPDVHYREPLNDREIEKRLDEARKGRKGEQFTALYDRGEIPTGLTHSDADWMLLKHLGYWLGPDVKAIDQAFRSSGLMREKWNSMRRGETFGQYRIHSALEAFHLYHPFVGSYGDGVCRLKLGGKEEPILSLINRIVKDEEHKDAVSVLPMLCGMGKSTAISQMIRQTIEMEPVTGNGLVVITDRTERLHEYMEPYDPELKRYLDDHQHLVTILDAESVANGALTSQRLSPVVLMTTQRFFRLSREEVLEYLTWDFGDRPLVLIDERPEIRTNIGIDGTVLGQINAALNGTFQGIHSGIGYALGLLTRDCNHLISETQDNLTELPRYRFLWKPDFDSYHGETENDEIDVLNEIGRNRMKLEESVSGRGPKQIFQSIHAILDMEREPGLVCSNLVSREGDRTQYNTTITTMTDNRHCIQGIPAKVIILDGTAEISPEYLLDEYDFRDDCQTKRPLNHLRIKIISLNTTRSRLDSSDDYATMIGRTVRQYVDTSGIREDPNWVLFTYQDHREKLKDIIGAPASDYFGDIVGKNSFNKARHIVQIGLNRFPEWVYFRCLLDEYMSSINKQEMENQGEADGPIGQNGAETEIKSEESQGRDNELRKLVDVNEKWRPFSSRIGTSPVTPIELMKSQSEILDGFAKKHAEELQDIMCRSLFAEIEQMIFRGIIRNADCAEDYTYHLFIDIEKYPGLFSQMLDRYVPLGAQIEIIPTLPGAILFDLMARSGIHGSETQVQRLVKWHDRELNAGDAYEDADLYAASGSGSTKAWRKFKSTHRAWLSLLLDTERSPDGNGFHKVSNWYY